MTHEDYINKVNDEEYPDDPTVPLPPNFANEAGNIENLLFLEGYYVQIASVALISSVAGAIRSNHFHRTDWHFMYVVEGRMDYFWRPHKKKTSKEPNPLNVKVFLGGEMMFTPPMVEHATYFKEPTKIITFSRNIRKHKGHEADLVRVKLIEVIDGRLETCV